ncbi:MAG: hypothetical protein JWR50_934 [Mucilaginibacter sp.]|nr:hypothetical protein [Mucilaginibacter sp.]
MRPFICSGLIISTFFFLRFSRASGTFKLTHKIPRLANVELTNRSYGTRRLQFIAIKIGRCDKGIGLWRCFAPYSFSKKTCIITVRKPSDNEQLNLFVFYNKLIYS